MKRVTICVCILLLAVMLLSCGDETFTRSPMDANVSFTPTVYYSQDGAISFLYDKDRDMLSTMLGYGQSVVALYEGGDYSLVISYEETQRTRKEAEAAVKAEFGADGNITLSEKSEAVTVSDFTFRCMEMTAIDGSTGCVLFGNTANGYAQIYYIISADAKEDTKAHVEEILSTVTFGMHETDTDDNVEIYLQ